MSGVDRPALNEAGHKEKPMDKDEYDGTREFVGIINGLGCSIMLMILIGLVLYNLFN